MKDISDLCRGKSISNILFNAAPIFAIYLLDFFSFNKPKKYQNLRLLPWFFVPVYMPSWYFTLLFISQSFISLILFSFRISIYMNLYKHIKLHIIYFSYKLYICASFCNNSYQRTCVCIDSIKKFFFYENIKPRFDYIIKICFRLKWILPNLIEHMNWT